MRRRHLLGGHLDALMNSSLPHALIAHLLGGRRGGNFRLEMETARADYPDFAFYNAMNSLGTHDTLRILTYLGHRYPAAGVDQGSTARVRHERRGAPPGHRTAGVGHRRTIAFRRAHSLLRR